MTEKGGESKVSVLCALARRPARPSYHGDSMGNIPMIRSAGLTASALRPLLGVALAAMAAAGCDLVEQAGGGEAPRSEAGPATDLVDDMAGRGRLPQRDYVCVLAGEGEDQPYGTLGMATDRFTLILKGGGRREGMLAVGEDRRITVDGEARRVTGARVNTEGQTVELAFDFSPAEDGRDQIVCRAEA
jgi:hypothetical protein